MPQETDSEDDGEVRKLNAVRKNGKRFEIGPLKTGCAGGNGLIDLYAIRFPNETASVRFWADFEIIEEEESDECSE